MPPNRLVQPKTPVQRAVPAVEPAQLSGSKVEVGRRARVRALTGRAADNFRFVSVGNPIVSVLCDSQIRELVSIEPFQENDKRPGKVSFGVSSYGYDVRVGTLFKIFTNVSATGGQAIVDPKKFDDTSFVTVDTDDTGKDHVIIPPNSFALCETVETFAIPRDVLAICVGKSTYARCGIIVNVTPLEPEWRGKVTIEISNTTPLPAKIYANEGIAQMIFLQADRTCAVSYADKNGKYQDQVGLVLPRVD